VEDTVVVEFMTVVAYQYPPVCQFGRIWIGLTRHGC